MRARYAASALSLFVLTVLIGKTVAVGAGYFRFGEQFRFADLIRAPASDLLLALAAFAMICILERTPASGSRLRSAVRAASSLAQSVLALVLVLATIFYMLCGYVFWDYGGYLENHLFRLAYHALVEDSLRYFLTRPIVAVFLLVLGAGGALLVFFAKKLLHSPPSRRVMAGAAIFLAVGACPALGPIRYPYRYAPAVPSPILFALLPEPANALDLGPEFEKPSLDGFAPPQARAVPAEYLKYRGAARGRDVIFVSLESVRRSNVSVYGYARNTTPNLMRLAGNSLVFGQAYVTQPRSSKTMESIALGIDPDPRKETMTWNPEMIEGRPNFFGALARLGYRIYFAIGVRKDSDGFSDFMKTAAGPALDRAVGRQELLKKYESRAGPGGVGLDDAMIVEDFLEWYAAQKGRSAAVVWFLGAHHPYVCSRKPFEEKRDIDRYDNCIFSSDVAIGRLMEGLRAIGKRPLIVFFGDHGEAFGEHLGDWNRGNFLFDQTVRVPLLIYDPESFAARHDVDARFTLKDIPATVLFLLGIEERIGESEPIFSRKADEKVYMSTVYGDYKLGMVSGGEKFVWRPQRGLSYLYDLARDPEETVNLVARRSREEIQLKQRELTQWYFDRIARTERMSADEEAKGRAYLARYPGVAAHPFFGLRPQTARIHYVRHGKGEGRIW